METNPATVILHIDAGPDADVEEQAVLIRRLRANLLERDAEAVDVPHSGAAPQGAKGDVVTLSTLAVTLGPLVIAELMKAVQTWLTRHDRATITVESGGEKIVVTGSPSPEQQRVIDTFVSRHKS
jgi:Effector Associated Constant Component 1